MKYSLPLALTTFIVMLFQWADTFMIGYFKTASDVGIYNAALPTAKLLYMVPYALTALLLPVISELIAKKDLSSLKTTYQTTTKWIFVMNISIATLFILFSQNILKLLFGAEYIGGAFSLVILSIGYFVFYLALTSESILLSLEKTKLLFYVSFFGSLLNIILNLILIPRYGINGAAIATSISVVLIALLWLIRSYKFVKIMPFRWSYFKILFSVIVSALLVKYLLVKTFDVNNNYILIGGFILFLIVYLVLLIVTRSLEEQDIRILKNIKNNIFNHIGGRL